jgi:hypothetical protein
MTDAAELERQYFDRGKSLLGRNAGGLLANLLRAKSGNIALARAELERASTKQDPREWLAKIAAPRGSGLAGNGYADEFVLRAAAQLRERESAREPSAVERKAVAAMHERYRGHKSVDNSDPCRRDGRVARTSEHGRRVLADLERRRAQAERPDDVLARTTKLAAEADELDRQP